VPRSDAIALTAYETKITEAKNVEVERFHSAEMVMVIVINRSVVENKNIATLHLTGCSVTSSPFCDCIALLNLLLAA
jgi:hypothetical protein